MIFASFLFSLSNIARLHYLKTSIKGEAVQLLKHVSVTETNFNVAWDLLKARYDNKRVIITLHFSSFINLPKVGNNSPDELKRLIDTTNEALLGIKNLNRPVDELSDILVFLISQKLDNWTLKEWEMQLGSSTDYPTFKSLNEFLETRIRALEAIQLSKNLNSDKSKNSNPQTTRSHAASTSSKCVMCKENHSLYKCNQFKDLPVEKRKEICMRNRCCFNCLVLGHKPYSCGSKLKCNYCQRKHNSLLHINFKNDVNDTSNQKSMVNSQSLILNQQSDNDDKGENSNSVNVSHVKIQEPCESAQILNSQSGLLSHTLLATALVDVKTDNGQIHKFRILLDQGSECCFVSEKAFKILNPRYNRINALVLGVGGMNVGEAKKLAHFEIISREADCPNLFIKALVLINLTSYSPPLSMGLKNDLKTTDLLLADPNPFNDSRIDFIIGADKFGECLLPGLEQNLFGSLTAQASIFGWILSGPVSGNAPVKPLSSHQVGVSTDTLHEELTRFCQLEESPAKISLTEEEARCEEYFLSTFSRLDSGRYMVRLPFKTDFPIDIGNSFERSKIILSKVMQRISKNPATLKKYLAFMSEYIETGHMQIVKEGDLKDVSQVVYIPHHPIIRESSSLLNCGLCLTPQV